MHSGPNQNNRVNSSALSPTQDETKLRDFFSFITADLETHARFVNTLSFLEYVGARKILKSQPEDRINSERLAHVSEEIRHAQLFKRMALALSDGRLVTYSQEFLWEGEGAWNYFQGLDQACFKQLKEPNPGLNYLLTTYAIETRAQSAYETYLDFAAPEPRFEIHRKLLSGILAEEKSHLAETKAAIQAVLPESEKVLLELRQFESDLFWSWIQFCKTA